MTPFRGRRRSNWMLPGLVLCATAFLTGTAQEKEAASRPMPSLVKTNGRYGLLVDGTPFLILGGQLHNSSAWPASMPAAWAALESAHVNTMEAPVYWETMEPEEGRFDFSQADLLIDQSRQHGVRLILLWFGTWKNGSGHYVPEWMKRNETKYPHLISAEQTTVDSLSPHAPATLAADKRAFAALMRHLRTKDPQRTVIMVQVENESGTWGAVRDHSPAAEALFRQNVPPAVLTSMGKQQGGSWEKVFGEEADGFFHAWAVASYIDQVAAAGKAEYPLPLYVNAALRDPLSPGKQGSWESGGPTDDVLPIWKAVASHIDILAPDIYLPEHGKYTKVLDLYGTASNALFVPETGDGARFARYCFAAVGHGAIGWSPFGIDHAGYPPHHPTSPKDPERTDGQLRYDYDVLGEADQVLAKLNLEDKVQGSAEAEQVHTERLSFGKWTAVVSYGLPSFGMGKAAPGNDPPRGEALIAQLGPDEFLVAAYAARVDFEPAGEEKVRHRQFIAAEEGRYTGGRWVQSRNLNGDETDYGLNFATDARWLRVRLATY